MSHGLTDWHHILEWLRKFGLDELGDIDQLGGRTTWW